MRIREITFNNFRSFRGERWISFVDPLTDMVRPLTVLAGSNGSGKTTVLKAIEALLNYVLNPDEPADFVREAWETGLIRLVLEISPEELEPEDLPANLNTPVLVNVAVGQSNLAPAHPNQEWPNLFCHLVPRGTGGNHFKRKAPVVERLRKGILKMLQSPEELRGGLLYFPHDRQLGDVRGGPVEPPPEERQWVFHFLPKVGWKGSLEQLWVWQNYLDLEKGNRTVSKMLPFVSQVEQILGENRKITIQEGRVRVPVGWHTDQGEVPQVRLDQLPSGEQQVLLLFGELARRRRQGAVIAIDEIENSLHPTLQRLTMWNLRQLARDWDAQVIVTTHSLEVINAVRGGAFINLDYPQNRFDLPIPDREAETA